MTAAGFALSTLLLLLVAIPSLVIGIGEIGFPEDDRALRWIPIAVGGIAGGIAVLSTLTYLAGAGLQAAIGNPTHPARITIDGARETGTYINERPRIAFDLLVEPEGRAAYRVEKKATVPHTSLGSIEPGDGFEALVDPEDPESIAIDWEKPIPGEDRDPGERLRRLEQLREDGLITGAEYDEQRRRIIGSV